MRQYALATALLVLSNTTFASTIEDTAVAGLDKPAIYYKTHKRYTKTIRHLFPRTGT